MAKPIACSLYPSASFSQHPRRGDKSHARLPWITGSRWNRLTIAAAFLCLLPASVGHCAITLPLQGYYCPNRYLAVKISAEANDQVISGAGVIPTAIPSSAPPIVPVLITGSPHELSFTRADSIPLRPIAENEKLVASNIDAIHIAQPLFPGAKILFIPLDRADSLPGPPAAWECLDAVILDLPAMRRLNDDQISAFLSAGITLAAVSDSAPSPNWPWRQEGPLWILRHVPIGPAGRIVDGAVYSPTYALQGTWPASTRHTILFAGVLITLLAFAACLLRAKLAMAALITIIATSTVAVALWRQTLPTTIHGTGKILITGGPLVQRDTWLYERARETGPQSLPWDGCTHPIFVSPDQIDPSRLRIQIAASGALSFEYLARKNETLAFLHRDTQAAPAPTATPTRNSPLQELAKDAYLTGAEKIIGETTEMPNQWPTVVIENSAER